MKRNTKRCISMCLSLALTAASMQITLNNNTPEQVNKKENSAVQTTGLSENVSASDSDSSDERFSVLTIENNGVISADGKTVGKSYGGFSVSDNKITVDIDGKKLTLEEAEKELGCQVIYDKNGNAIITSPFQTSRIIVKSEKEFDSCGAVSVEERFSGVYLLAYNSPSEAYKAYLELSECEDIEYVEADSVCQVCESAPDEERLDIRSWGLEKIGSDEFRKNLNETNEELPEVKVAVIDTGIYFEHNTFKGRILDGGMSFVSGYGASPDDKNGHGSHCAGIICSATNDNVKILPVQVLDADGYGDNISIYSGIMYAVEQGVDVISMSLGGYGKSNLIDEAITAARKKGITVCVAAGNETLDNVEMYSLLGANEDCVVVASVDMELKPSYFSNFGASIDFAAPGERINSVGIKNEEDVVSMSGTSMATPFVAACFADVLSYDTSYDSDTLYELMKANAIDICDEGFDNESGWGLVNLGDFHFSNERVEKPSVSVEGGFYEEGFDIELSCRTEKADIYYTLDGSKPTVEKGIKYDGKPITISETTRIRAISTFNGMTSPEITEYYSIQYLETSAAFIVEDGILKKYSGNASVVDIAEMTEKGELPEITAVDSCAFYGNCAIEEVILPDSVKTISSFAFADCYFLRKVECKAETLGMGAFRSCSVLEELVDDSLKSIDEYTFEECYELRTLNGKNLTVIPKSAFYLCTSIDSECFDFSKVTKVDLYAFNDSGLTGTVNLSNVEYIGHSAFMNAPISEISLSDKIEALPDNVFNGCFNLVKISAPAVKEIGMYSLALRKEAFNENTVVECDIDFSGIETIGEGGFLGYVFDKPASFDSLDSNTFINVFAEAYGEELHLPTLTEIKSLDFSFETLENISHYFNVNALYLENAEYFVEMPITSCNALIFGNAEDGAASKLSLSSENIAYNMHIYTYERNEELAEVCENASIEYGTLPALFIFEGTDNYTFFRGQEAYVNIYAVGDCTTKMYKVDKKGKETLVADSFAMPVEINTEKSGNFEYVVKQFDSEKNVINEQTFSVKVEEPVSKVIKADEYTLIDVENSVIEGISENVINYKFSPEESGTYTIYLSGVDVTISKDGEELENINSTYLANYEFEFEKDSEYEIRATFYADEYLESISDYYYIFIKSESNELQHINDVVNIYDVDFSGWDGTDESFMPTVTIYDLEGNVLVEGEDYVFELIDGAVHYGDNSYSIKGIGKYFGTLSESIYTINRPVAIDEEVEIAAYETVSFTAEKDGFYKIIIKPSESAVEEAIENNSKIEDELFTPDISIFPDESTVPGESTGSLIADMFSGIEPSTFNDDMNVLVVKLVEGGRYDIISNDVDARIVITESSSVTLAECKIDAELNYEYNGEEVNPDIKITTPSGKELVEGEDYIVKCWNNDGVGFMYTYIEGIGKHAGAIQLPMLINDGTYGMKFAPVETSAGYIDVVNVELGKKFIAVEGIIYSLTLDEDTRVFMESPEDLYILNADVTNISMEVEPQPDYMEVPENETMLFANDSSNLKAGVNIITFNNLEDVGSAEVTLDVSTDGLIPIEEVDIICNDLEYTGEEQVPEIILTYDGVELVEGEDYEVIVEPESEIGIYSANILAMGEKFTGCYIINYAINGETPVISEKITTVNAEETYVPYTFKWTPEKDKYNISCSSLRVVNATIYDSHKETVWTGNISSRFNKDIYVEAGQTYTISVVSEIEQEFDLILQSENILSDCQLENDSIIELTGENVRPSVVFINGDYTLVEDVDYELLSDCYIEDLGLREYIYKGIGDYCGEVCVPVVAYSKTLPEADYFEVPLGFYSIVGGDLPSGSRQFFKFTSYAEETKTYSISIVQMLEAPAERATLLAYNESGELISINSYEYTLSKGETVYFAVINPYVVDSDTAVYDTMSVLRVYEKEEEIPEETTTTTTTTSSTDTTTTTTTETTTASTTESSSTSSSSTSTDKSTTTSSTSGSSSTTTTTPSGEEGNLPQTGMNAKVNRSAWISAIVMTLSGIFVTLKSRKKEEEE